MFPPFKLYHLFVCSQTRGSVSRRNISKHAVLGRLLSLGGLLGSSPTLWVLVCVLSLPVFLNVLKERESRDSWAGIYTHDSGILFMSRN